MVLCLSELFHSSVCVRCKKITWGRALNHSCFQILLEKTVNMNKPIINQDKSQYIEKTKKS